MKRLAAMHDWPLFWMRAVTAIGTVRVEVGARAHDEGVRAPELEHAGLERASRGGPHGAAGAAQNR